jgi:hypothetical protein
MEIMANHMNIRILPSEIRRMVMAKDVLLQTWPMISNVTDSSPTTIKVLKFSNGISYPCFPNPRPIAIVVHMVPARVAS